MKATRCLREEHQVILRVLDGFEIALKRSGEKGEATRETYGPFLEFFRGFADRCHHCKEEDRLFPVLEKNGVPREGGPIGVMLYEHKLGRALVAEMTGCLDAADAGEAGGVRTLLEKGGEFLEMLRAHITKEDHVLFEMADQLTRGDDLAALLADYSDAESEPEYCATYARCSRLAERLSAGS
ncbi:MAG: hypothetical protein GY719_32250 [bacterium]|nr:hypothetical protein [bacterium]